MQKKSGKALSNREIQEALIENFVNLQRVLTNLSIKFDNLSDNISKLLQLFEISAKSFIKKTEGTTVGEDRELLNKLDTLLDQNKTIAKGLTLIEEKVRHRISGEHLPTNIMRPSILSESKVREERAAGERPKPKPLPRI